MKRYDQNFKSEALKLSDDIGVKKACEQLNVNYGTLAVWRKRRAKKNSEDFIRFYRPLITYLFIRFSKKKVLKADNEA